MADNCHLGNYDIAINLIRQRQLDKLQKIMTTNLDNIQLFAGKHAIEVVNFVVNLGLPIDHADIRRFDERVDDLRELFPAINTPDVFQIALGAPQPGQPRPPAPVPVKELTFFANDGTPTWVGAFSDSKIVVSCRRYTDWERVWPEAKSRIEALLGCLDSYKPVYSVDFSVTDTFKASKSDGALIPSQIFRENGWIAKKILESSDPRWDFNQGWYEDPSANDQVLIRVDGRSGIQNDLVVASIGNLHSQRFGQSLGVGDLVQTDQEDGSSLSNKVFASFQKKNKFLLRNLLVDDLLHRMRLKSKDV